MTADPSTAPPGVHTPSPPEPDPRFPWRTRGTRKPLEPWDRVKFLLLLGAIFAVLVWNAVLTYSPVITGAAAVVLIGWQQQWVLWLVVLEALRQVHFVIAENSAGYHQFWQQQVFAAYNAGMDRRFKPYTRFRLLRVRTWIFWIVVVAIVLGKVTNTNPIAGLFQAPALLWQALPTILQLVLTLFFVVFQFAAIFWFMSRGGVETYFPDDITRRFSDVWGQDPVLERIKENIVLLEDPESIERRGGYVPGGILLYGPPGTGKTLIAEAVAGETGKPYVFVDPGAFQNMFMGVGILKVKSLFRKLRKLALRYGGVIVFFDEADSLGSRGGVVSQHRPHPVLDGAGCHGFAHLSAATREALAEPGLLGAGGIADKVITGMPMGGGRGGDMGTLQALLAEISGLVKPRGFVNRYVRKALGMKPKPPPKYRILIMMASNLPDALDPALMRPGRIDRKYRVGYPSKAGRIRTYQGYFGKVTHTLTDDDIEKLATITPYETGASMKDLVNESLIYAIREGRETVTWSDVMRAKHLKTLGPPEDVEYIERERHAVAVHEACHAVMAWKTRDHMQIDLATIEKGSDYLGMVMSFNAEDQFTRWRTEYESDILVSLASLAGERMFYGRDNSSGVSGDLTSATLVAGLMETRWGMGEGISSHEALERLGIRGGMPESRPRTGGTIGFGSSAPVRRDDPQGGDAGQRVEALLARLLTQAEEVLTEHRAEVLVLAHALETHKTLTGEDVVAILEGTAGPIVDGRPYRDEAFRADLERYHQVAVEAHTQHAPVARPMPTLPGAVVEEVVDPAWLQHAASTPADAVHETPPAPPRAEGPTPPQ